MLFLALKRVQKHLKTCSKLSKIGSNNQIRPKKSIPKKQLCGAIFELQITA
jgi:hypothetical protein